MSMTAVWLNEREYNAGMCFSRNPENIILSENRPDTEQLSCGSTYMRYLAWSNSWRQKVDSGCQGLVGESGGRS